VIGGEATAYTDKCKELAKKNKVEDKIIWAGLMDYETKLNAYASCDLFVLPSKRESLGTVILEAMAQKRPVISTNNGGVPDVVADKFSLYEPGDVKTLVKKINKTLEDEKFAKQLGEKGLKKAEEFSYKSVSKRYLKIIESLKK